MNALPPDFELPPGEATLKCPCGFESRPFCFVEQLYRCKACRTVDRPLKVPFLYLPPKCSVCDRQFDTDDRIHASSMRASFLCSKEFGNRKGDVTLCPKCGSTSLAVNSLGVDYECMETDQVTPKPGDTIHARTMKSVTPKLDFVVASPRLSLSYSVSCEIQNLDTKEIEDGHHEFRVISVNESKPRLILEYLRKLPASEWRWFFGTH
jgi:hypothetical protein